MDMMLSYLSLFLAILPMLLPMLLVGTVIPVSAAAAGAVGSPYVTKLTYTTKATGNYPITEANFAGIGVYIPGWVLIIGATPANVTVSVSNDNGTTWVALGNTGGGWVYVDSGTTVRINIVTAATTIYLFPMGR
jgi:hypothetical protein